MPELTAEGRRIIADVARRHGVSEGAVAELLAALVAGGGGQAQFNHADLGGMGQWSQGGMVMVGDMFNNALKARVDALCAELARLLPAAGLFAPAVASRQSQSQGQRGGIGVSLFVPGSLASAEWWPADLGSPASVGAQNDLRYAFFPAARRLAIARGGQVTVYDTGDHRIGGFSQQQSGDQSLTFTSQHGLVRVADLPVLRGSAAPAGPAAAAPAAPAGADDIFARIEQLAALRAKDILTDQEFEAKKAELLSRL
jgi:Short C-terminal domain